MNNLEKEKLEVEERFKRNNSEVGNRSILDPGF